jgi:hypothetical protein
MNGRIVPTRSFRESTTSHEWAPSHRRRSGLSASRRTEHAFVLTNPINDGVPFMSEDTASANLQHVLEQRSERVRKPTSTVLFRLGEKASGMFFVLSGKVRLDLGVDSAVGRTYGPPPRNCHS